MITICFWFPYFNERNIKSNLHQPLDNIIQDSDIDIVSFLQESTITFQRGIHHRTDLCFNWCRPKLTNSLGKKSQCRSKHLQGGFHCAGTPRAVLFQLLFDEQVLQGQHLLKVRRGLSYTDLSFKNNRLLKLDK